MLWAWLEPLVLAVAVTQFGVTLVGVDGASMMPNLRHHERLLIPKYETWLHKLGVGEFRRGDILVFKPPTHDLDRPLLGRWAGSVDPSPHPPALSGQAADRAAGRPGAGVGR